jgi:hypothetical protein
MKSVLQVAFVDYLKYLNLCYYFHYVTVNRISNNLLKISALKRPDHLILSRHSCK